MNIFSKFFDIIIEASFAVEIERNKRIIDQSYRLIAIFDERVEKLNAFLDDGRNNRK